VPIEWCIGGNRSSGNHGWSEARARGVRLLAPTRVDGLNGEPQLEALYDRLNEHHFGATLPPISVRRGLLTFPPPDADILAQCRTRIPAGKDPEVAITIHMAEALFVDASMDERNRWRQFSRCLLHEMVHVAVDLDALGGRYADEIDGHGQEFANECNRIGRSAGWDHVVAADRAVTDEEDPRWWPLGAVCEWCSPTVRTGDREGGSQHGLARR